jgi:diphosphomevalonate decarboxylase
VRLRSACAVAHSNIALVKYWGKSDTQKNLPAVPSLSLTLDALKTRTSVQPDASLCTDQIELDGTSLEGRERARVVALLDRVRALVGNQTRASVKSHNDFPTAAGLASSASGFAALAVAAADAFDLGAPAAALSALARQSSASAARSLFGGFVNLLANAEHAEPLAPREHWDLKLLVAITEAGRKPMGSTEAMQQTRATSPYYGAWLDHSPILHQQAERAVRERNFEVLGTAMEQSTLMMHASMLAANPAIIFLTEGSLSVIRKVRALRSAGLPCYFTVDAGPHVKVLVQSRVASAASTEIRALSCVRQLIDCAPGPGAQLVPSENV